MRRREQRSAVPSVRIGGGVHHILSRAAIAILAAVAGLAGTSVLGTSPASAATNGLFSIVPTSPPSSLHGRPYFTPVLQAGVPVNDSATVINYTNTPLTLVLYAADAFTTSQGGFSIQPNYKPKRGMGAWIKLPVTKLTVPPKAQSVVQFSFEVPPETPAGDYAGGIVAAEAVGSTAHAGAITVTKVLAVGARVYGRVIGRLTPRLAVTSVQIHLHHKSLGAQFGGSVSTSVRYSITNTGNEYLSPAATIALSPLLGSGPKPIHVNLPQILPGSTVTFTHNFKNVTPFGLLTATVTATAPEIHVTGTATNVVIPWGVVAIVVVLLLILFYFSLRRKRRPQPRHAAGSRKPRNGPDSPTGRSSRRKAASARGP